VLDTAGSLQTTNGQTLTIGGGTSGNLVIGQSGKNITLPGYTGQNGILYATQTTGVLAQATTASTGLCLVSGASAPSWTTCPGGTGTTQWDIANGAIYSGNSTLDLLLGGNATTSAKFAVLNINSGTPTASLSAGLAGGAFLDATGSLQTTAKQTLTLGGGDTGNISIDTASANSIAIGATSNNITLGHITTATTNISGGNINLNGNTNVASGNDFTVVSGETIFTGAAAGGLTTFKVNNHTSGGSIAVFQNAAVDVFTITNGGGVTATNTLTISGSRLGGAAGLIVNQGGASTNDIFAASSSGVTKFTIKNDGTASSSAGFTIDGVGSVQSTNNQSLTLGGGTTGDLTLGRSSQNLFLPNFTTSYGLLYTTSAGLMAQVGSGSNGQCLNGNTSAAPTWGACDGAGSVNVWDSANGIITQGNTTQDLLVGGTSTDSAKFAILNINGSGPATATIAGNMIIMPQNGVGGRLGIGLTNPSYNIDTTVVNGQRGLNVTGTTSTNGQSFYGNYNTLSYTGGSGSPGIIAGTRNDVSITGANSVNSRVYGTYNSLTLGATANSAYGSYNIFDPQTFTSTNMYGYYNDFGNDVSSSQDGYGLYNLASPASQSISTKTGVYNKFDNITGSIGVRNVFTAEQTSVNLKGLINDFSNTAAVNGLGYTGVENNFTTTRGGNYIGIDNTITSTSATSLVYGVMNTLAIGAGATGGDIYAVYNDITNNGGSTGATIFGDYTQLTTTGTSTPKSYGLYVLDATGTTTGTQYGAYFALNDADATKNWAVYVEDASSNSYFGDNGIDWGTGGTADTTLIRGASGQLNLTGRQQITGGITGGNAALIVNQNGISTNDIFAASASGATKFVINNDGTASSSAGFTIDGVGNIQSTLGQTLTIGGGTSGNLVLGQSGKNILFGSSTFANCSALETVGGILGCGTDDTGAGGADNFWQYNSSTGIVANGNLTTDFLLGATSTASAKFSITNVAGSLSPVASISATTASGGNGNGIVLGADGTIQSLRNNNLTIGGSTTGNILLSPNNGSGGFVNLTGTLNIANATTSNLGVFDTSNSSANGVSIDINSSSTQYALNVTSNNGSTTGLYVRGDGKVSVGGDDGSSIGSAFEVDALNAAGVVSEQVLFGTAVQLITLADGATLATQRHNQFRAPDVSGVVGGSTETITDAATVYIDGAPTGSNITFTNGPYALWVDSGLTRFDGGATLSGNLVFTGSQTIANRNFAPLTIGDSQTGELVLSGRGGSNTGIKFAGYSDCTLKSDTNGLISCGSDNLGANFWQYNASTGIVANGNLTTDLLLGGTSTASAKFAVTGINADTPVATLSASNGRGLSIGYDGSIQTTLKQSLTIGGSTTGNITLSPNGGNGTVTSTGNLILASGKALLIGTDSVLSQFGSDTIRVGAGAGAALSTGSYNTMLGFNAGNIVSSGADNVLIGAEAGLSTNASFNTFVGSGAGRSNTSGRSGVFIGYNAGYNETLSNKLYIANSNTTTPLITGDFGVHSVGINTTSVSMGTAALTINQPSTHDILAASASGVTKFVIKNDGTASSSAGFTIDGIGNIQSTNNQTLTVGGDTTGDIILSPRNSVSGSAILPGADNTVALGSSPSARFKDLFLGPTSLHIQCKTGDGCAQNLDYSLGVNTTSGSLEFGVNSTSGNNRGFLSLSQGGVLSLGKAGYLNGVLAFNSSGAVTAPTISAEADGDLTLSAPSGFVNIGSGTGDISLDPGAGNLVANLSSTGDFLVQDNGATYVTFADNATTTFDFPGTTTDAVTINANALTTGKALTIGSATTYTSTVSLTGNLLNISRNPTSGASGVITTTGALASLTDNCTITSGTCTNSANVLSLTQSYGLATGSVLNIANSGNGAGATITSISGGQAALIINKTGNLDIFTASASGVAKFTVTNSGGIRLGTNEGTSNQCLLSGGVGSGATWGTCPSGTGTTQWDIASGAIYSGNSTLDLLIGGNSTASAKFAVLGINNARGQQTASISGNLVLDATGSLQTTNNQTLTIGGDTTGNIILNPRNAVAGGFIAPFADNVTDLGSSPSARFRSLYLGPGSLHIICTTTDGCGQTTDYSFGVNTTTGSFEIGVNKNSNTTPALTVAQGSNVNITGTLNVTGTVISNGTNGATIASATCVTTQNGIVIGSADCPIGMSPLQLSAGVITQRNITTDFLLGGVSTDSAKFAITNIVGARGTQVATLSGSIVLDSEGSLQTTRNQTLTLGGGTTGDLVIGQSGKNITLPGYTGQNGILYATQTTGVLAQATTASTGLCLVSGASAPSWTTCPGGTGTTQWDIANGAIYSGNSTLDLLLGGNATLSAKFAVLNINNGTPTASVSAGVNGALFVTADGNIQTTAKQTLTIGGGNTGNIVLSPLSTTTLGGSTVFSSLSTGIAHIGSNGLLSSSAVNLASSDVTGILGIANGGSPFNQNSSLGTIFAGNSTLDFLLGGTATESAKFAILGINDARGSQTASISGNLVLDAAGSLQTTKMQTLTIGGDTTGDIFIRPANSLGMVHLIHGISGTGGLMLQDSEADETAKFGRLKFAHSTNSQAPVTGLIGAVGGGRNQLYLGGNSLSENAMTMIRFFTAATTTTVTGTERLRIDETGALTVGNVPTLGTAALATMDMRGISGILPVASVSGATSFAALTVDNSGSGDIFTASSSGLQRFTVQQSGNVNIGTGSATEKLTLNGGNFLQKADGNPVLKGTFNTPNNAQDIYIAGKYAYVADGTTLQVIDISNPSSPIQIGTNSSFTAAVSVYVAGKYAYVVDTTAAIGLKVLDISNPLAPQVIGTYAGGGNGMDVFVTGNKAYYLDTIDGLTILDISNPANPIRLYKDVSVTQLAESIYVMGKYAYVGDFNNLLYIFDISDSSSPTLVKQQNVTNTVRGVYVSGKYVYLAQNTLGLMIVDVSNPNAPTIVGSLDTTGNATGVFVSGKYAYLSTGTSGLQIIDISNPTLPQYIGAYDTSGSALNSFVSGKYAYVSDGTSGLQVVDINGIDSPAASIGNISTNSLLVSENTDIGNNLSIGGGVTIGVGGLLANGTFSFITASGAGNLIQGAPTGQALLVLNNTGTQDIFSASASGVAKFTITNSGGIRLGTNEGNSGECLKSGGVGSGATWGSCGVGSSSAFDISLGAIMPSNTTLDFLAGGTSSSSAAFRVTGQNNPFKGTVVGASVSANTSFAGLVVDNSGVGDIFTASSSGMTRFTVKQNGIVQIGNDTNGIVFDYLNQGPRFAGSARPLKNITLMAEYAGATLTASGSATTTGSMTSDASASAQLSNFTNYYEWSSTSTTLQDYTVAVRVKLPADFSAWPTSTSAAQIKFNTELGNPDTNRLDVYIYNGTFGGMTAAQAATPVAYRQAQRTISKTWTNIDIAGTLLDSGAANDLDTAGDEVIIMLKMSSKDSNHVQVGDITLNYLSSF
ncbi:MAG: hypothetical protein Q7T74_01785, partial [Candidatus Saccharibacteria bacterium]|nr:hypothetical protein [Candidatus Saccharibacteria bacterium]